jgi:hypothetical protein
LNVLAAAAESKGLSGLIDESRRPKRSPMRTSAELALERVQLSTEHPRWGPKKIVAILAKRHPGMTVPSVVTVARVLRDAGLQQRVLRRQSGGLSVAPAHLIPTASCATLRSTRSRERITFCKVGDAASRQPTRHLRAVASSGYVGRASTVPAARVRGLGEPAPSRDPRVPPSGEPRAARAARRSTPSLHGRPAPPARSEGSNPRPPRLGTARWPCHTRHDPALVSTREATIGPGAGACPVPARFRPIVGWHRTSSVARRVS